MSYRVERWKEFHQPNPAMLRMILEREGYRVFQWTDRPNAFYGLHKHSEEQSHWIISGSLELTIAKHETYTLNAGDRDFMPAETYHSARVTSEEPVIYLVGEKIQVVEKKKRGRKKKWA